MLVLGLHGSPRRKGNTHFLLTTFLDEAAQQGARTAAVDVTRKNIVPCKELVVCEKKGFCPIDDDMHQIYALLRAAEVIVAASPVFFYNVTAQLKALIDRCQTLWARKYRLKLVDPLHKIRCGVLLSAGATRGQNLFEGMKLTTQYFFDAIDATFSASLTYRGIEGPKDMAGHEGVREELHETVQRVLSPLLGRKRVLFAGRRDACHSQMAGAFAQMYAGDRLDVMTAGSEPADAVNPVMVAVMQEKGIDMAFRKPKDIQTAIAEGPPEMFVNMGTGENGPPVPGAEAVAWDMTASADQPIEVMRKVRDEIEEKVNRFIREVTA
jgi:multimeric flavodoxin WrbA